MAPRRRVKCGRMTAVAIKASMPAAIRTDGITRTPSPVVIPIGFVITTDVTYSDLTVDAVDGAARNGCQSKRDHQPNRP